MAIFMVGVDKGGKSALALSRELGLPYVTVWLLHHKIQHAMADRNRRYQLGGLLELDDAYFGGISHGPGKQGRGTSRRQGPGGYAPVSRGNFSPCGEASGTMG